MSYIVEFNDKNEAYIGGMYGEVPTFEQAESLIFELERIRSFGKERIERHNKDIAGKLFP